MASYQMNRTLLRRIESKTTYYLYMNAEITELCSLFFNHFITMKKDNTYIYFE